MATLGSTAEPTSGQEWFGLNTTNHFAVKLTMPAGGPWEITRLGAWLAGKDEACNFRLCVWSSGGSLLGQTATQTASSRSFGLGQNDKYEANLLTPVEVDGGDDVWVGFARDPADNVQFGTRSGTRHQKYSSSWPSSLSGYSSVSAANGAWIDNYQSANQAPNAPTSLSPSGSEVVHEGTAPVVSGTRSDPDSGDYISAYQIKAYRDDGTDLVYDSGKIEFAGSSHTTFARSISLPSAHAYYKWKARTWDKEDVAGPYSSLQRFYANAVPATPAAPTVETDTLTPTISGGFSDSGDSAAAVQIEVELNVSPFTSKWDSGDLAITGAWSKTYAGAALAWGTAYRARARVKDSHGGYSSWSSWRTFTPVQPVGPSNLTPRTTNPRLNDLTPDLTVGHSAQFRNDEVEVRSADGGGGTQLWLKTWDGVDYAATTSKVRTYAGSALSWGQTVYWRARIELTDGTITSWSAWYPIRFNAVPAVPTGMSPTGGLVLTDTTPQLRANFSDPDTDQGDTPSLVSIEVRNNATDALVFSQTGVAPSPGLGEDGETYSHRVSTSALTVDVTYKWRARFTDAMGQQGPWSSYQLFKISTAPTAAVSSPANGGTVTESTPTLDWTFTGSGGKTQHSYQVRLYDKGPVGANYADEELVWDSGEVISSASQADVPIGILIDDHDYRWEVTVKDTDLLSYTLS